MGAPNPGTPWGHPSLQYPTLTEDLLGAWGPGSRVSVASSPASLPDCRNRRGKQREVAWGSSRRGGRLAGEQGDGQHTVSTGQTPRGRTLVGVTPPGGCS